MKNPFLYSLLLATAIVAIVGPWANPAQASPQDKLDQKIGALKEKFSKIDVSRSLIENDEKFVRGNYDLLVSALKRFKVPEADMPDAVLGVWIYARTVSPFTKDPNAVPKAMERIRQKEDAFGQMRVRSGALLDTTIDGKKGPSTDYVLTIETGKHVVTAGLKHPQTKEVFKNKLTDFKF